MSIPDGVMKTARQVAHEAGCELAVGAVDIIARALMAEREHCNSTLNLQRAAFKQMLDDIRNA